MGRENIKNYWQSAINAGLMAASVKTIDAVSDGDLIITDIGKYAEILKRNAQGKWVSIYGMWSANEPAPVHK